MSDLLPSVTVIIPARPEPAEILAVTAAQRLDYPPDKLQIIVARGKQPSVQRNAALRAARDAFDALGQVGVRSRDKGELGAMGLEELAAKLLEESRPPVA